MLIARGPGRLLSAADVQRLDEVLVAAVGRQERDKLVANAHGKNNRAAAKKAAASEAPSANSFDDNGPTDGKSGAEDDDDDANAGSTSGDKFQQPDDAEEEDGEGEEEAEESEEEEETAGPAAGPTNSFPDNGSSPRTATKGKRGEAARLGFDNAGDAWKRGADKRVGVQTARLDPGAIAPVQTEGDEISVRGPTALPRRPPARPATRASRPAAYPPRPSPPGPTLAHVHLRSATRRSPRSSRARATSFSRSCGRTSSKAPS